MAASTRTSALGRRLWVYALLPALTCCAAAPSSSGALAPGATAPATSGVGPASASATPADPAAQIASEPGSAPASQGTAALGTASQSTASQGAAAQDAAPDDSETTLLPSVELEVERAYDPATPPRLKGRIAAAGQDEELARWNVGGNSDPDYVSSRAGFHPGARVVVDIDVKSGGLPKLAPVDRRTGRPRKGRPSQQSLLAHARKWGYWEFRICFEGALRKLDTDHGQTKLRLRLAADGSVTRSKLQSSELSDNEAARCLETAAKNYRPFTPAPGRRVDLELSIKLWPGDAPLPPLGLEPARLERHLKQNPGDIDPDIFRAAINPALDELERCYARGVARDDKLWGRVLLEIQVLPAGGTAKVRENGSHFPDRKVVRCVRKAVRQLNFPAPKGGTVTRMLGLRFGAPPIATE